MEDKPLVTFIPKRRKIKTFVATSTYMPDTYIPDTYPDTYIPNVKAKKRRSRFLKLLKRVFGFLWGVFLKVVEIAFLIVVLFVWGLLEGIARGSNADEREWERRKKEEEERRRREEARRWWMEENERYRKWLLWNDYEYRIQTGQASGPNPYQNPYY